MGYLGKVFFFSGIQFVFSVMSLLYLLYVSMAMVVSINYIKHLLQMGFIWWFVFFQPSFGIDTCLRKDTNKIWFILLHLPDWNLGRRYKNKCSIHFNIIRNSRYWNVLLAFLVGEFVFFTFFLNIFYIFFTLFGSCFSESFFFGEFSSY